MNEIITINKQDIRLKEYKGQRVVTFKDIDTVHERAEGTARKRLNDNRKHFIEGTDFFKITPSEFRTAIGDMDLRQQNDVTLITESGYLMLVKSFTDDLAWEVQRQLVNSYFKIAKPLSQVDMMRIQLGMIDDHEERIANLENNMTLDYGQQRVLEDTVNKTVIDALGGKGSYAYKGIGRKVFAECNRDLKHYFNVNARNNIPRKRFDEALTYAKNWKPCTNTLMFINNYNAQQVLDI
ncbi:MAG: ORF6C domain-containing protein [Roseburia sp.]|nr:ORF6C domain-containing protein [Roseburia sp.]